MLAKLKDTITSIIVVTATAMAIARTAIAMVIINRHFDLKPVSKVAVMLESYLVA